MVGREWKRGLMIMLGLQSFRSGWDGAKAVKDIAKLPWGWGISRANPSATQYCEKAPQFNTQVVRETAPSERLHDDQIGCRGRDEGNREPATQGSSQTVVAASDAARGSQSS